MEWKPDVVFNLLEEFNGIVTYDQHVVAFLELMRQPYTGCNPRGLLLARDKVLCKQLLAFHRIPTPQFAVFRRGERFHVPRRLRFPLFVKSATEDASLGIAQASVVEDAARLRERVQFMHEQIGSDALVEEYIEGRELYVGVLGNERLTRLPVWEMKFGSLPDSMPAIATRKVKWDRAYQQKYGITTARGRDLPPQVLARLDRLARRIYRALHLSGYARIDFRLRADGMLYVLEANPNPNIEREEDFAAAARAAGVGYGEAPRSHHAPRAALPRRVAHRLRLNPDEASILTLLMFAGVLAAVGSAALPNPTCARSSSPRSRQRCPANTAIRARR
jgi:D-alanine-D-alanine ligase